MSRKRTSIANEGISLSDTQMTYKEFKQRVLEDLLVSKAWDSEPTQRCVAIVNYMETLPWHAKRKAWNEIMNSTRQVREDLSKAYSVLTYFVMYDEIERRR